ncbi:MAG: DnaJ domain-containing protein [Syntrophaceae bacterium]|nr:DnaJ domain-containing protein [Syntrophaceae bacterium]
MNRNHEVDSARRLLGITKKDTAEDAKKKYRELAKIWHPDVNKNQEAHDKMQALNKAYALLMKEEFGVLDIWEDYNRWWWRQYGNDPIWGNYYPAETPAEKNKKKKITEKKDI